LFKVAVPKVGLFDLIGTKDYGNEFGSIYNSEEFDYRLNLSPVHHVKNEGTYPAMLIVTAENDDRVPSFNSFKFTALLQNTSNNSNPIMLRVEERAGHFGASNYAGWVEEMAEIYSFIFHNMGVKPK